MIDWNKPKVKIQDFDFNPNASDAVLDRAEQWLKDNYGSFHNRANYAVFNDTDVEECIDQNCHGRMGSFQLNNRVCIANECAIARRWGDEVPPGVYEFFDWLTVSSPFARFILRSNYYGFVISADIPCVLLQNINIICRHFWEAGEAAFFAFQDLISRGYSGDLAYGICFNSNISRCPKTWSVEGKDYAAYPKFDFSNEQIYDHGASHRAWGLWYSLASLQNFLNGEFGRSFENDCRPNQHFRNIQTMYGGSAYCGNSYRSASFVTDVLEGYPDIREKLSQYRKDDTAVPVISNPFAKPDFTKPAKKPASINYNELIDIILPMMKEKDLI